MSLSLVNPDSIVDLGISVDSQYRFENEENFNPLDIKWKFFGSPREIVVYESGKVEILYGLEHAFGFIVSTENSYVIYDILYGLLIERVYSDYDYDFNDSLSE